MVDKWIGRDWEWWQTGLALAAVIGLSVLVLGFVIPSYDAIIDPFTTDAERLAPKVQPTADADPWRESNIELWGDSHVRLGLMYGIDLDRATADRALRAAFEGSDAGGASMWFMDIFYSKQDWAHELEELLLDEGDSPREYLMSVKFAGLVVGAEEYSDKYRNNLDLPYHQAQMRFFTKRISELRSEMGAQRAEG
ncbi:MAG: hypothetical protein OXK21_00695 [Chloroflexota bacterium]|nr:hypothetical protein [Chloroflexota bacterium]